MTLTRSRNSHSGLHICGRFMISWVVVFLPDGAFMGMTRGSRASKSLFQGSSSSSKR
jgi:hypothetical protein